jgi:hypothetical protein
MIQCPRCNATLPDANVVCQFCGADVSKVARPVPVTRDRGPLTPTPQWVMGAYYAISVYYIVEALYEIGIGCVALNGKGGSFAGGFSIAMGVLTLIIGLGLLFKIEIVRGIVNFFCGLQILFGLFGLAGAVMGTMLFGALGFLNVVMQMLQIATAGFMIYLIGETDTKGPNF